MVDGMIFSHMSPKTANVNQPEKLDAPPPGSVWVVDAAKAVDSIQLSTAVQRLEEMDAMQLGGIEQGLGRIRLPSLSSMLDELRGYLEANLQAMREAHPGQFQRLRQATAQLQAGSVANADQLLALGEMVAAAAPERFVSFVDGAEEAVRQVGGLNVGGAGKDVAGSPSRHLLLATMNLLARLPVPPGEAPAVLGEAEAKIQSLSSQTLTTTSIRLERGRTETTVRQQSEPAPRKPTLPRDSVQVRPSMNAAGKAVKKD